MRSIKIRHLSILFFIILSMLSAQESKTTGLFKTLKQNDSLLFNEGFNKCDLSQFEALIAEDFEFYHDKVGIVDSKKAFMNTIKNGLCNTSNKTTSRRQLVDKSLSVYPLYNKGILYGAIQKGKHRFFETQNEQKEHKGSIAKFTHLWIKKGNSWRIKRVLSYDHKTLEE